MQRIIKIKGGAGNQLFQYAYAKTFEVVKKDSVYLDCSDYCNDIVKKEFAPRELFLDKLNINLPLVNKHSNISYYEKLRRKITKNYNVKYDDKMSCFSPNKRIILDGYWQSPLYFTPVFHKFYNDFTAKAENLRTEFHVAQQQISEHTICVHVRRGDYTDRQLINLYGLCSAEYFKSAIFRIRSFYRDARVFVFTDDYLNAKELFDDVKNTVFVEEFGLTLIEEFELMRLCNHFVISNSTLSWWAAFLETYKDASKSCIAPYPWFNDDRLYCSSLYLPSWIKLRK